jgi:hypothetical protein
MRELSMKPTQLLKQQLTSVRVIGRIALSAKHLQGILDNHPTPWWAMRMAGVSVVRPQCVSLRGPPRDQVRMGP